MRVLPAAPAAAHQCAIVRTLLVFCLLAGFAVAKSAAQSVSLLSLQPEVAARAPQLLAVQAGLYRDGVSGIDGLEGAWGIAVSADGSLLFVTADFDDALSVWRVNAEAGTLTQSVLYLDDDGIEGLPEGAAGEFDGLFGPSAIALSPDGSLLFVTAIEDVLSVWQVNAEAGTLTQSALYRDDRRGGNFGGLNGLLGLALSPDGSLLFVTARSGDSLSVWRVNAAQGTIEQTQLLEDDSGNIDGLNGANGLVLNADGTLLFVTGQDDNALSVWRVNAAEGTLMLSALYLDDDGTEGLPEGAAGEFDGLGGAEALTLSPDGSLLFVTGQDDDALSVWRVDAFSGTLTQSALYKNSRPFGGLDGAADLALSPDGSTLFVTAQSDDALSIWQVNAEAGTLRQRTLYIDDSSGGDFDGLDGALRDGILSLTLSSDGRLLFVTANVDNALSVWHIIPRVLSVEQVMLRARISTARSENTTLVITARQNEQMVAREATLLAGETSAAAVFEAGALGTTGRWTFEVTETRPPDVLTNLESVRARVQIARLITLELTASEMPLMRGAMFTVTVAAAPAPPTELNVRVSLTGRRVTEVMKTATLTRETPSQDLTFTVPENTLRTLMLATQTTVEDALLAAVTEATATVMAVPIQPFDFVQPEGTVTVDDLVFALRYLMLCAGGCSDDAEMQALTVNLPPLRLGIDLATIDIESTLATVTGDSASAQGIVILMQYLSEIPSELLLPGADESARQDALEAIRAILAPTQQEE